MTEFMQSNLGSFLKQVYSTDQIEELRQLNSELIKLIKKSRSHHVGGQGFYFAIEATGGNAFGHRADNAALPTARVFDVQNAVVQPRPFFGTVEFTGLAKSIASKQMDAFANLTAYAIDQRLREMTSYEEGELFGDNTGLLATVTAVNGTTITVDSVNRLIGFDGIHVDVFDGTTADATDLTVTNISWENNTFTISNATGVDIGDDIYLAGTQSNGSIVAREYDGLAVSTADSGSYLTVSRSSYPRWKGNVIAAGNTSLDEDLFFRALNRMTVEVTTSAASLQKCRALAHVNQLRKFAEVVYPRQQFSGSNVDLGVTKIRYGGIEFLDSPRCPETDVYIVDMNVWKKFVTDDGDLQISSDFGEPIKFVPGYDIGRAYMRSYANYVVTNPRKTARISGLANVSSR